MPTAIPSAAAIRARRSRTPRTEQDLRSELSASRHTSATRDTIPHRGCRAQNQFLAVHPPHRRGGRGGQPRPRSRVGRPLRRSRRLGTAERCRRRDAGRVAAPCGPAARQPALQRRRHLEPRGWIVRQGRVELSVGSGRRRVVVGVRWPGDVEGDIPLLLGTPAALQRTIRRPGNLPAPARRGLRITAGLPAGDPPPLALQRRRATGHQPHPADRSARPLVAGAARRSAAGRGGGRCRGAPPAHARGDARRRPTIAEQGPQGFRTPRHITIGYGSVQIGDVAALARIRDAG